MNAEAHNEKRGLMVADEGVVVLFDRNEVTSVVRTPVARGALDPSAAGTTRPGRDRSRADLQGVAWNGHEFLAVGQVPNDSGGYSFNYIAYASPDGSVWTQVGEFTLGPAAHSLTWGTTNKQWVVVGTTGNGAAVATSPDGVAWDSVPFGDDIGELFASTDSKGIVVVAGARGHIVFSPDTKIGWGRAESQGSESIDAVVPTEDGFLAVDSTGALLSSADARAWRSAGTLPRSVSSLTPCGDNLIAVSDSQSKTIAVYEVGTAGVQQTVAEIPLKNDSYTSALATCVAGQWAILLSDGTVRYS